jgi:predicted enzyme related to lactoylglutathione lyase
MSYAMIKTTATDATGMPSVTGSINGGMFRREGDLTSPVVTVDVEDIDATLEKIQSLGGSTVLPRQEIGTMGWTAYFRDTEGNVVGLWQNAPRQGGPGSAAADDIGA